MRPPRVLVATPIVSGKLYCFEEVIDCLRQQETDLLYDWLVIDNTPVPDPGYLDWLKSLVDSKPLGYGHRIRVVRFGEDVDGRHIAHPLHRVLYAERLFFQKFVSWKSYDHLLSLECDVLMPPHGLQTLYDTGLDWAAAWMTSRWIQDPERPELPWIKVPLLWHGLTPELHNAAKVFAQIMPLGYLEPPSQDPFPCNATHLGCTFLRGQMVRSVPFRMTSNAGGDISYSWACGDAGYQLMGVPAVTCDHIAEVERPNWKPPWASRSRGDTPGQMPAVAHAASPEV